LVDAPEILIGFAETDFLNLQRVFQLRKYFGSLENAWKCTNIDDFCLAGIRQKSVELFFEKRKKTCPGKILEVLQKISARMIFWDDGDYPDVLRNIPSPPIFLFIRGNEKTTENIFLSVVGTRKISSHGRQIMEGMIPSIVSAGVSIISGMARGVDTIAHQKAVLSKGHTIAVFGNGIDMIYPVENRTLSKEILDSGGALLSEFVPGVPPYAHNFPRRNRIISGLSFGTLVVEGAEKSGSLITARIALDQGKEVFAIPGSPLVNVSRGPNRLLQRGEAKLVLSAQDILEDLPLSSFPPLLKDQEDSYVDPKEKIIFELLSSEPILFDDMVRRGNISSSDLLATLTHLEMKGVVASTGGNYWMRKI
jgi:DNA processing protein